MSAQKRACIALEDGTLYEGISFGADARTVGEVVFNTSMMGYQEILTDPSYSNQIVTMTYPLIGNYGATDEDLESARPHVRGFVVREISRIRSNWRSREDLSTFLVRHGIPGVEDIDTRALTRRLRMQGVMKGCLATEPYNPDELVDQARAWVGLVGEDIVKDVTTPEPYDWAEGSLDLNISPSHRLRPAEGDRHFVVAYDFGIKRNILRRLVDEGCRVRVVPAGTPAAEVLALRPDGVFLSNGPGDPEPVTYAVEAIRGLLGKVPVFGICLGHQLMGLALGGATYKLKFGHRGGNQPVKDLTTGKVEITSQNHGFCVDMDSLKKRNVQVTHVNLNDQTVEGLANPAEKYFCVQYHPEASPGPHDASYLFPRFTETIRAAKG